MITANRGFIFPLADERLQSSNGLLKDIIVKVDTEIQELYDIKADKADTYTKDDVDGLFGEFDIYGTYIDGDVNTDTDTSAPEWRRRLLLKEVATAGTYTKVTINNKGLVVGAEATIVKDDISNFHENEYIHWSEKDDNQVSSVKVWSSYKIDAEIDSLRTDVADTYVRLDSYSDSDVLNKIKNVDGAGSGLNADQLDGEEGAYYLDWVNFTNVFTNTIESSTATDAQEINFSTAESFHYILDKDISFLTSNLTDGQKGKIIFENAFPEFTVSGLSSLDKEVTITNISGGLTLADLVGKRVKIKSKKSTFGSENYVTRTIVSVDAAIATLDEELDSLNDSAQGFVVPTVTLPNSVVLEGKLSEENLAVQVMEYVIQGSKIYCTVVNQERTIDSGSGTSIDLDFASGNNHHIYLDEDMKVSISNLKDGQSGHIIIRKTNATFDVTGLDHGDDNKVYLKNFSKNDLAYYVGKSVEFTINGATTSKTIVSDNGKEAVSLTSAFGSATSDSGTGYYKVGTEVTFDVAGLDDGDAVITVSNLSAGTAADLVGKLISLTVDGDEVDATVSSASGNDLTLSEVIPTAANATGTGSSFDRETFNVAGVNDTDIHIYVSNISSSMEDLLGKEVHIKVDGSYRVKTINEYLGKEVTVSSSLPTGTDTGTAEYDPIITFDDLMKFEGNNKTLTYDDQSIDIVDYFVSKGVYCKLRKDFA
jgi:hypothetical protein